MGLHHSWTVTEDTGTRKTSVCQTCGIKVEHSSKSSPSIFSSGRLLNGNPIKIREPLPLCINAVKRIKLAPRHVWVALGDAPDSPSGAKCHAVQCSECGMTVEAIKSLKGVAAKNVVPGIWRRYRTSETEEWNRGCPPPCKPKHEDKIGEFVKANWDKITIAEIARTLKISEDTVRARAKRIGLKSKFTAGGDRPWTEREDQAVIWHFGVKSAKMIAKEIDRTYNAIIRRAYKLGLVKQGCIQGYESLEQASKRTGYNIEQLRRMIKGRNIIPRKSEGYVEARAGKTKRKLYSIDDIDECVEAWHETETFTQGCIRLDIDPHVMRKALEKIGVVKPPDIKGKMWRVPSDKLEEAAAYQRTLISPTEYARLRGISPNTIIKKLKKVGIERPFRSSVWYLPESVIEEALKLNPIETKFKRKDL